MDFSRHLSEEKEPIMHRMNQHPILEIIPRATFEILVDGKPLLAYEGETVAATLLANGIRSFRHTQKFHEPRGIFCGIGQCTDCIMEVDSKPNVRTCVTLVHPGMTVNTQNGLGSNKTGRGNGAVR